MRSANLVGAFAFWRNLEGLAQPEERTRFHAQGVLHALAESHFRDCGGVAFREQHAEAFRYCGFEPVRIAAPGKLNASFRTHHAGIVSKSQKIPVFRPIL
jgi:hypothetical protein